MSHREQFSSIGQRLNSLIERVEIELESRDYFHGASVPLNDKLELFYGIKQRLLFVHDIGDNNLQPQHVLSTQSVFIRATACAKIPELYELLEKKKINRAETITKAAEVADMLTAWLPGIETSVIEDEEEEA